MYLVITLQMNLRLAVFQILQFYKNYTKGESEVSQKLLAYSSKGPLKKVKTTIKVSDRKKIVDIVVIKSNK